MPNRFICVTTGDGFHGRSTERREMCTSNQNVLTLAMPDVIIRRWLIRKAWPESRVQNVSIKENIEIGILEELQPFEHNKCLALIITTHFATTTTTFHFKIPQNLLNMHSIVCVVYLSMARSSSAGSQCVYYSWRGWWNPRNRFHNTQKHQYHDVICGSTFSPPAYRRYHRAGTHYLDFPRPICGSIVFYQRARVNSAFWWQILTNFCWSASNSIAHSFVLFKFVVVVFVCVWHLISTKFRNVRLLLFFSFVRFSYPLSAGCILEMF